MGAVKKLMMEIAEQDDLIQYYEGLGKEKALDMTMREFLEITQYRDVTVSTEAVLRRIRKESAREVLAEFKDKLEGTKE